MRTSAAVLSLCLCSLAQAETTYKTVAEYVDSATNGSLANHVCHVTSDYPKYRGCSLGSFFHNPRISRVFGMLQTVSDRTGFVFVLEPLSSGRFRVEVESRPFQLPDNYMIVVEAFDADANDQLHVQFTSGSASMPDSDIYHFRLIEGRWRVAKLEHRTLARCDDGSVGDGDGYLANFLTGKVHVKKFKDCTLATSKSYRARFPLFLMSEFAPLDAKYIPRAVSGAQ